MYEGFNLSTCFLFLPYNYSYPRGCEVTLRLIFLIVMIFNIKEFEEYKSKCSLSFYTS